MNMSENMNNERNQSKGNSNNYRIINISKPYTHPHFSTLNNTPP